MRKRKRKRKRRKKKEEEERKKRKEKKRKEKKRKEKRKSENKYVKTCLVYILIRAVNISNSYLFKISLTFLLDNFMLFYKCFHELVIEYEFILFLYFIQENNVDKGI